MKIDNAEEISHLQNHGVWSIMIIWLMYTRVGNYFPKGTWEIGPIMDGQTNRLNLNSAGGAHVSREEGEWGLSSARPLFFSLQPFKRVLASFSHSCNALIYILFCNFQLISHGPHRGSQRTRCGPRATKCPVVIYMIGWSEAQTTFLKICNSEFLSFFEKEPTVQNQ